MNHLKSLLLFSVIFPFISCQAQSGNSKPQAASSGQVQVYYFHYTARCVTCRTVESETKSDVESLYGDKVSFQALNLDDDSSTALAEKLKVSGQTLLIVKGDEKINITNEGFLYARSDPEKFKSVIREKIDGLLQE